ncbi:uncharacterized protein TrAFT101_007927 [Trichoderma asperellum]|uniref:uncharacterized protein n=1 Tax=Trichoderma asperellum TaxID=101201 RepID=UPI00332E6031|nr:hypothetical protein TrAFT101_007927 [Trichoderma asperellum]
MPLFYISIGALGSNTNDIEKAHGHAFELYFSTQRDGIHVLKQARILPEYPILSLTINCPASLNYAFQSRIDLLLPYGNFTTDARRQVWQKFAKRAGGAERFNVRYKDYNRLSVLELNGREIKDLVKSARLFSMESEKHLTANRLVQLAEMRIEAMNMLNGDGDMV